MVTITENDAQPTVFTLTVEPTSVSESVGADTDVTVTVSFTEGVSLPADTVFNLAVGGSAVEGTGTSDY